MSEQTKLKGIFEYVHPYCFDLAPDYGTGETYKQTAARIKRTLAKKRMHFMAAAAWISAAMKDSTNYEYRPDGNIQFNNDFRPVVYNDRGTRLVWIKSTFTPSIWVGEDLALRPVEIGQLRYISQAMLNSLIELRDEGRREMTPAEIEKEFDLAAGTVRQHVGRKEQYLTGCGAMRRPDARTILIRRGYAINTWGAQCTE